MKRPSQLSRLRILSIRSEVVHNEEINGKISCILFNYQNCSTKSSLFISHLTFSILRERKEHKCSIRDLLRASPPKHLLKKSDLFFLIQASSNTSYEFSRY